jgi:hypothetical protein
MFRGIKITILQKGISIYLYRWFIYILVIMSLKILVLRASDVRETLRLTGKGYYEAWTNTEDAAMFSAPELDFEVHSWKESEDPFDRALCAKILCRPKEGKVPGRENVQQVFEVIGKLFTTLGGSRKYFPVRIYFILGVWLCRKDKSFEILEKTYSRVSEMFQLHTSRIFRSYMRCLLRDHWEYNDVEVS